MAKRPANLAEAMLKGRAAPHSREAVLSRLLLRRAQAQQTGDRETEARLREQIRWCLPLQHPED